MSRVPLRDEDLEIVHLKGSGPGGQNRNKRQTGVRITHLPTGIVALATERRTQGDNLRVARERLEEKLARHFFRPKKRRATRPTGSSKARRLDAKRRRSEVKRRRSGDWD